MGEHSIEALAISSFAEAGLPVDKNGNALFPIIAWFDRRSETQARRLENQGSISDFYLITGQRVDTSFGAVKWMWIRDNHPAISRKLYRWLSVPDYIYWRLTGEQATDYTLASRTLLLDQTNLDWSPEMLDLAGLKKDQLPPVHPSGAPVGKISPRASRETGLQPGTPCYLGGHDHLCASMACGASRSGVIIDSSGTAQAILMTIPSFLPDPGIAVKGYACYAHIVPGLYVLKGGLKAAGGAIDWLVRQLAGLNASAQDLPYEKLEQSAREGIGKSIGPLWLPHFIGSGSPDGDRFSHAAMVGVQLHHSQGDIYRGMLEGLAFWLKNNLETMQEFGRQKIHQGFILGGTIRIKLLVQLKADVLDIPMIVPAIPEPSAAGAALLAALGCGYFNTPEEAVSSVRYDSITIKPDPEHSEWYSKVYSRIYRDMYPSLMKINHSMHALVDHPGINR